VYAWKFTHEDLGVEVRLSSQQIQDLCPPFGWPESLRDVAKLYSHLLNGTVPLWKGRDAIDNDCHLHLNIVASSRPGESIGRPCIEPAAL
jgi:hypothetical protein